MTSGALAALLTNPLELVKIRAQANVAAHLSMWTIGRQIVAQEGVGALWQGVGASVQRSALLTAGQMASYDTLKAHVTQACPSWDCRTVAVVSAWLASVVTTTVTSPLDVIKTRLMQQRARQRAGASVAAVSGQPPPGYRGTTHALSCIVREEGVHALFRGWIPNYLRQGPQTMIILGMTEILRAWAGLAPL